VKGAGIQGTGDKVQGGTMGVTREAGHDG